MMKTHLCSVLATTCFALCGWSFLQHEAASAFSVRYDGPSNGVYSYTISLSEDESLAEGDGLRFTDLVGVTRVEADFPYEVQITPAGEVDLRVQTDFPGPDTFEVAIFSEAVSGLVNYTAEYQDGIIESRISINEQITGPAAAQAVPFEFSPSNGLLCLAVLFGLKRGWKLLMSKEKPAI